MREGKVELIFWAFYGEPEETQEAQGQYRVAWRRISKKWMWTESDSLLISQCLHHRHYHPMVSSRCLL